MIGDTSTRAVRLFIAISLPEAIKAEIEKAQLELRRAAPEATVRWTRPEQFHLTLRFLGDVQEHRVETLTMALRDACRDFSPLRLRAGQIGFFPGSHSPRVIWAGIRDERGELPLLQKAVEAAMADFSTERAEERFTGHVTLGRIRGIRRAETERLAALAVSMADRCFGEWTANEVRVVRSELAPTGARHTVVAGVPLAGEPAQSKR